MFDLWLLSQEDNIDYWIEFKNRFPHAKRMVIKTSVDQALYECAKQSFTYMFFTVGDTLSIDDNWSFSFTPEKYDQHYIHAWPNQQNGYFDLENIILWPTYKTCQTSDIKKLFDNNVKLHLNTVSNFKTFDIFFISYEEENADKNWKIFKQRFTSAKRIHKIKGIQHAHNLCALLSTTDMFYTVDADTIVNENWDFTFVPPIYDRKYLHVWYSKNPINDLAYGYGAIKLWPKSKLLKFNKPWLDFTTSLGDIKIIETVIATTYFNTSAYDTWKSAFRECVKLLHNIAIDTTDDESHLRLNIWKTTFNDVPFNEWAKHGALDAIEWYKNTEDIGMINNFDQLKEYFLKHYTNYKHMELSENDKY